MSKKSLIDGLCQVFKNDVIHRFQDKIIYLDFLKVCKELKSQTALNSIKKLYITFFPIKISRKKNKPRFRLLL